MSPASVAVPADGRRTNLARVLRHVARRGPRSRARIADELGLNKSTVSALVRELLERELLEWTMTTEVGARGRPARTVSLSGARYAGVGATLGPRRSAVRAVDLGGTTRFHRVLPAPNRDETPEAALARLAGLVAAALAALAEQGLVTTGVGVAVPGLVRGDSGVMLAAPSLDWPTVAVARDLGAALGEPDLPVHVEKEAGVGAFGELWRGVGRDVDSFVYVSGAGSVEAGVIIDGAPFGGADGFAGELGHLQVDPLDRPCPCGGSGCLETMVGAEALAELAGEPGAEPMAAARALAERAAAGEDRARRAIAGLGMWLGIGLSSLCNLFNPEAIVVGGHFAPLAEWLLPAAEAELRCRVLSARWSRPALTAERDGSDPVGHGAALRALAPLLDDPTGPAPAGAYGASSATRV